MTSQNLNRRDFMRVAGMSFGALLLGNRIALMESGSLHGVYTPQEFVTKPDALVRRYVEAFQATQHIFQT